MLSQIWEEMFNLKDYLSVSPIRVNRWTMKYWKYKLLVKIWDYCMSNVMKGSAIKSFEELQNEFAVGKESNFY